MPSKRCFGVKLRKKVFVIEKFLSFLTFCPICLCLFGKIAVTRRWRENKTTKRTEKIKGTKTKRTEVTDRTKVTNKHTKYTDKRADERRYSQRDTCEGAEERETTQRNTTASGQTNSRQGDGDEVTGICRGNIDIQWWMDECED